VNGISPASVKSVVILQSLAFAIEDVVKIEFKLPIFNFFQTPHGL
jgi:hypothetical protein